jgi:hypothetical protein
MVLKKALGVRLGGNLGGIKLQGMGTEIGQSVTAWIVDQWSTLILNILECDPYAAHETQWIAMEMNGIAVIRLLTADGKVECLKGKRFPSIHRAQEVEHERFKGQPANGGMLQPAILEPRGGAVAAIPKAEGLRETGLQLPDDGLKRREKSRILQRQHTKAVIVEGVRFRAPATKMASGQQFGKISSINQGLTCEIESHQVRREGRAVRGPTAGVRSARERFSSTRLRWGL